MSEVCRGRRVVRRGQFYPIICPVVQVEAENEGPSQSQQVDKKEETGTQLWQIKTPELWQQNQYLLESGEFSDTTFIVGQIPNCVTFHCHKLMLAKASPVFEAMLFGPLAEKKDIHVIDVESNIFEAMLQYIYTGKVVIKENKMALDLCMAADKYMIAHLKQKCIKKLIIDLVPENVCQVHELARALNLTELADHAFKVIVEETDNVLSTPEFFCDTSQEQILLLVQQETLNIKSEAKLIEVCIKWAEYEAKRQGLNNETEVLRNILGPIFKHLRFLALSTKQFTNVIENSNVLTDKEKCSILFILIKKDYTKIPDGISKSLFPHIHKFPSVPIFIFSNNLCYTNTANTDINLTNNNIPFVNTLDFKVNTDVYMIGFMAIQKPSNNCSTFSFGTQAFYDSTINFNSVFLKGPTGIIDTGSINNVGRITSTYWMNHHKHKFEKKVLLQKNIVYTITLISHKLQFIPQIMTTPVIAKNVYSDESVAPNNLSSTLTGIVYKKA